MKHNRIHQLNLTVVLIEIIFLTGCKKPEVDAEPITESVEIHVEDVHHDSKNVYFRTIIRNNTDSYFYFPVNNDISIQFNFINKSIDSLYWSSFYTQYFDEKNNTLLGFVHTPDYIKNGFRNTLDSINEMDSFYKNKYGSLPNIENLDRKLWGIKYHGLKKNGFFLPPKESKEIIVRSHLCFDAQAYAFDISCFDSKTLQQANQARILMYIDSAQVKRDWLLPNDIDSLNIQKIEIFHGMVQSNKVWFTY